MCDVYIVNWCRDTSMSIKWRVGKMFTSKEVARRVVESD